MIRNLTDSNTEGAPTDGDHPDNVADDPSRNVAPAGDDPDATATDDDMPLSLDDIADAITDDLADADDDASDDTFLSLDDIGDDADRQDDPAPRCVADAIAWQCLRAALPAGIRRRIRQGAPVAVVIAAPGADWLPPIRRVLAREAANPCVIIRDGSGRSTHRPTEGNGEVASSLADGRAVIGVSHAPAQYLPATPLTCADAHVVMKAPDARILRAILRSHARGRIPRAIPDGVASGLTLNEIVAAFRGRHICARDVIANLQASTARKTIQIASDDTPRLENLHYDGAALDFGRAVIADVAAWRADPVALTWSAVTSRALLVGSPGVGKTLFGRALARSLDAQLIAVSCGDLFAHTDGHLHSVLQA